MANFCWAYSPPAHGGNHAPPPAAPAKNEFTNVLMSSVQKAATKIYLVFAMVVFSFAATGKLLSNFLDPKIKSHDPFFTFLSNGQLMVIVAIIEITVVAILARAYVQNPKMGVFVVLWLCLLFAVYRMGFYFAPTKAGSCKCFGVGSIFGTMEAKSDAASMVLLLIMLLGGIGLLCTQRIKHVRRLNNTILPSVAASIIGFIFFNCGQAYAQTFIPIYTAQGFVEEHLLSSSGKIIKTHNFPFTVSLDSNGHWQITWQTYYPEWSATSTEYIAFNGTDVFSVVYSDKRLGKDMKPVSNLPYENHEHPARVCRGPFPVDYSSCVGLLWVAFCGGEYIATHPTDNLPDLLVANARTDPIAWSTDFQNQLLVGSQNPLIVSGSFILNKAKVFPDLMHYPELDEPGKPENAEATLQVLNHLKNTQSADLLRGIYSLQDSKLVENIHIPMGFSATRYSPPDSVQGRFPLVEWHGYVTNFVRLTDATALLPPIKGRINVQDRRFEQRTETQFRNDIWYLLGQNGWVLSTNDARFQGTNAIHLLTRQSIKLRKTGYLFSMIMFALLISLPVFFVISKMRSKINN